MLLFKIVFWTSSQLHDERVWTKERKREYVYTGDGVGVMIDTENGNFSFALDGANLGVACERISLSYLVLF